MEGDEYASVTSDKHQQDNHISNQDEFRYKQIINSITDYIYSVRFDEKGLPNTIHTPSCLAITGYSIEEFNASPSLWIDIVHVEDRQRLLNFIQHIAQGSEKVIEHRIWHKNGILKWIQNTIITYFNPEGEYIGYDGVISDITESKSSAEQIRLSEEKFKGVFDLNPDALLLCNADSGEIHDYNQNFICEFHLIAEEIKKYKFDYQIHIIEDWENITREIRSRRNIPDREITSVSKNGTRHTFLLSATNIRVSSQNFIIYKFRNISKRKKQEYLLRFIGQRGSLYEGKRFFNDLAVFLFDLLRISHVVIVEINSDSHKGFPIVMLADGLILNPDSMDSAEIPFPELIKSGIYLYKQDIKALLPDTAKIKNEDFESSIGILLRDSDGLPSGYIALLNREPIDDIPEIQELLQIIALRVSHELENMHHMSKIADYREHLEDLVVLRTTELESTVQALHIAKERAESASKAKSSFLSNMSHELRTPLNAILGYAAALQKETNLLEKQRQNLHTIQTSGQHLLSIINEILDYSKLDAGKVVIDNEEFNLPNLLLSALNMIRHKSKEKMLEFRYSESTPIPEIVKGDEKRLRQIILNLVSNAIKYTSAGFVHVRVKFGVPVNDVFFFEVEDTGSGIAEENFGKIFEPFTQLHHQKSYIEGTGLGLSITKNLVELMKGKIYFRSILNKGSVFSFELPLTVISKGNTINLEAEFSQMTRLEKEIMVPEKEFLAKIMDHAKTGNFTAIEIQIEQVAGENGDYSDFCNVIKESCSKYNDDRIIAFCSKYLDHM